MIIVGKLYASQKCNRLNQCNTIY